MKPSRKQIVQWTVDAPDRRAWDELAVEEPLEIQVDTQSVSLTMRTPGHDDELAAGFLVTEGVVQRAGQIHAIRGHPRNREGNVIGVFLKPGVRIDWQRLTRHVFASSSCGICGKASIESVQHQFPKVQAKWRVRASKLLELPDLLQAHQTTFRRTGGLHAAALFTPGGKLVVLREDVGRHNAVDKVVGHGLLRGDFPWRRHVLLVSGRASFEIMQKALAARIAVVAAVSAPSSLAVEFAESSGQTLVGFLRNGRMNIYAHAERII